MLIAKTKQGDDILAQEASKGRNYHCGGCGQPVILKKGLQKEAHFAHKKAADCQLFSEAETAEHLRLKKHFKKWLGNAAVLEAYLPQLKQRPDILQQEEKLAIEIQCSVLSIEKLIERTCTYRDQGYDCWWILGNRFMQNHAFTQLEKSCCMYTKQRGIHSWKADLANGKLHLFHHISEMPVLKMRYHESTWDFYETDLLQLRNQQIICCQEKEKSSSTEGGTDYHRWLKQQLRRKQKRILSLQEKCYLRQKHLLHLPKWLYSKSRYFFFYQERLFYHRLLFEETASLDRKRHYECWEKEINRQKEPWLFPLVDEKQIRKGFFEECIRLFEKSESSKILHTHSLV
ncbi:MULTISPECIES: competence protein CoiA [unclassified Enterococcus]|jgi:competence protein CoiA|uniref:competence protein CoiA n=1 Tax=unclassified Enterococcus TaxID=2608891 RepID=UPI003D298EF2